MIFHGEEYYEVLFKTVAEAHERFEVQMHVYCLMGITDVISD